MALNLDGARRPAGAPEGPAARPSGRVVAVVGATATGKSSLAVTLARALGGEVVNADAFQLYRGMDVGTAKLTATQRQGVPHHLLDVWDVTETANVAAYQRMARACIDDLLAAGVPPVLVGGSGLYVRAALDPLEFPGTDPAVRARLQAELAERGAPAMHARLAALDPAAAAAILATNGRRVVRALEVIEITGRPFSATLPSFESVYDAVQVAVDVSLPELDARIDARVEAMFAAGLVEEVRRLQARGLRTGPTASRALGYQQVLAMLDGVLTEAEASAQTALATRRFARRQRSWFRRDPRVIWLAPGEDLIGRARSVTANRD